MQDIIDRANYINDKIGKFQVRFTLSPDLIQKEPTAINRLNWNSIKFGPDEILNIPEARGIYAFVVGNQSNTLPHHGYVMYVGITGLKPHRTLPVRYKEYLNDKKVLKRGDHIVRMLGVWYDVLRFYFAPVDPEFTFTQLSNLEKQINDALLPPFSRGDISGELKSMRNAF